MSKTEAEKIIQGNYILKIYQAYGHDEQSSKAGAAIAVSLNDIYRYFEPSFFDGHFYVVKHFKDDLVFDEKKGIPIYFDKNILINRTDGILIIQIFENGKLILWENEDIKVLSNRKDVLTYHFHGNKEEFFAYDKVIDVTSFPFGSMYAPQFHDLVKALNTYSINKVYHSSCPHFSKSWADGNRLFFQGGGSGSNEPEKFMQLSLHEFLSTYFLRGITIDAIREYNVGSEKPKPVDVKIHWKEANRVALIEIKFLGILKRAAGGITKHDSPRANSGISQLKGYHDSAAADMPTSIIKSLLVVIDGRRNNLKEDMTTIPCSDGLHFKNIEITIDDDKKFHESVKGFETPIRMFASPKCV